MLVNDQISTNHSFLNFSFLEYKVGQQTDVTQPTIASFTQTDQVYSLHLLRQQAISKVIIQDLIIGCCLPQSIVGFLNTFLRLWFGSTQRSLKKIIPEKQIPVLVSRVKENILKKQETQSLTTDLWSDWFWRFDNFFFYLTTNELSVFCLKWYRSLIKYF